jgi:threonine aldolase
MVPTGFSLGSDNHSGIHPEILQSIVDANFGHTPSYGTDEITQTIRPILKSVFGQSVEPNFVFNGTAANVLCLASLVESHQAVITASTSHLHMDECGAPENAIGCKLLLCPSTDGKLTISELEKHMSRLGDQHCSQPAAVSITLPTEYGTCYSLKELQEIRSWTKKHKLKLHIDGARLIYAAAYLGVSLKTITEDLGVDAVSVGGTKNGLLFGELVLLYDKSANEKFKYLRKQNMQLPSKMRFVSAQFHTLFGERQLWREIANHGIQMAKRLEVGLKHIPEVVITQKVEANSVFVKVPRPWVKELREKFFFYIWDESTFELRWMVSFDVTERKIDEFLELVKSLRNKQVE